MLLVVALGSVVVVTRARAPDTPPQLTARMVATIEHYGWDVAPDASATREAADEARRLAARSGPSKEEPARRVSGVSLVTVGAVPETGRRVWIVYVEHVAGRCFGPAETCGAPVGEAVSTEVAVVDGASFERLGSMVF
ncbi:MAG: hypothetical protein JWO76_2452 [Nocardioides sp.]|nr:hypothetical protein [Nocardioides sp.]